MSKATDQLNAEFSGARIRIDAPVEDAWLEILTPDAVRFVASLQREFGDRRKELLARREVRQQALAAADGEVVLVIDGLEEQVPGELPGMALSLDEADGNSVVIRIGDGLYLSYAHMQAGSITVAEGEEVERGAVIGLVGNSGNSSAPHLHVHLMDGPSPFASSGLPYVIESFETTGAIPSTELFDRIENTADRVPLKPAPGEGENADELPLDQTIVNFP